MQVVDGRQRRHKAWTVSGLRSELINYHYGVNATGRVAVTVSEVVPMLPAGQRRVNRLALKRPESQLSVNPSGPQLPGCKVGSVSARSKEDKVWPAPGTRWPSPTGAVPLALGPAQWDLDVEATGTGGAGSGALLWCVIPPAPNPALLQLPCEPQFGFDVCSAANGR